jgi:hypothetical protein
LAIRIVSAEELQRLWDENHVSEKREAGVFTEIISEPIEAGDPRYAGQFSVIIKLLTPNGYHIGTIHQIVDANGNVLTDRHPPHPKDYTLRDCSRVRTVHRQERLRTRILNQRPAWLKDIQGLC